MATLAELQDALRNAGKAGATDDAKRLADAIVSLKSNQAIPQQAKPRTLTEDPGFLKSGVIATGKTFDSLLDGATQMYLAARGEDSALNGLKANVDEKAAIYQPLKEAHPWATGIGESLPSMVIPGGGAKTLLGNAGRMALAGGIPAALEYGSPEERAKRGLVGAAAGASVPLVGSVLKTAKSFFEPLYESGRNAIAGRLLNTVAGDSAGAVRANMANAAPVVAGSMPTAAQVAESGGVAALERAASQANPEAYTRRAMEQSAARVNALRGIAGDDASLAAAEAARSSATKGLYDSAKKQFATNAPDLASALGRIPDSVMAKAHQLAKLSGDVLKQGVDVPATSVASGVLDASGNQIMNQVAAQQSRYSGKALHYIKLAMDDAIGRVGDGAMGNTEKGLATGAKDALLGAIDRQIPDYAAARGAFAALSKPVNQMQVGQELLQRMQGPLADFGGLANETGSIYARALRNADQTVRSATGMKNMTLDKVMSPEQMAVLNGIATDLARKANAQNLGRGVGSDTFQKLAMNNIAQQSGVPRLMGGLLEMPGISRATRWIYSDSDKKMQGLLADALLNPKESAALMEKASENGLLKSSPKARKALEQVVLRGGLLAAPASGSFANP